MTSEEKRKALERQRLQAGRLLRQGVSKAEVARRLSVAPSTVTGWAQRLERGGLEALKSRGRWGRRRGLDDGQRQALAEEGRRAGRWVCHRTLDPAAHRSTHRALIRGAIQ